MILLLSRGCVVSKRLPNTHTPSLNLKKSTLSLSLLSQLKFILFRLMAQEKRWL